MTEGTVNRLEELEKLLEKATPAPWGRYQDNYDNGTYCLISVRVRPHGTYCLISDVAGEHFVSASDLTAPTASSLT